MPLPGILKDWSFRKGSEVITAETDDLINRCRILYDSVADVPDPDVSYETVIKVMNAAERELYSEIFYLGGSHYFSPDEGIRDASREAETKFIKFNVEVQMRKDIFKKLLILQQKEKPLSPQAQRYLDVMVTKGKRNGLHLDESTQKKIKDHSTKIANLVCDFMKNIGDVNSKLRFTDEELDGPSTDFVKNLKRDESTGKAEVTLKYPHCVPVLGKCKVPETRKKMEFAFNTQCIVENDRVLTALRKLRHELATSLGYPSYAEYTTEILMAKNAESVDKFLSGLAEKLKPLWNEEKKLLLELKEKECAELNIHFDGKLNSWDTSYYINKAKEIKFNIDLEKLREYFPLPVVKEGMFEIYQDLLGLKFEVVHTEVWHKDVEVYSVADSNSGTLLGYFYLDLFPRPNKYGHAALFEMQHGYVDADGSRQVDLRAVVANFAQPTEDKPALLSHSEVKTFFHEFGHVMHYLCVETEFPCFRNKIQRDFVENPSKMLENWCLEERSLRKMSSHYKDKTPIPNDMLQSLLNSRVSFAGYLSLRQIALSFLDQKIHISPEGDIQEIYSKILEEIVGIEPQTGTNFACHFIHLAKDYAAVYYGYLWCEVYSMDMFQTRFGGDNVFNSEVGRDYREKILKPGGSKPPRDLIADLLGREPNQNAFLLSKELKV